ncbi:MULTISPECIES: hypothetical protein [unclassified Wolbachia]|uniref:hypothetical protein n=1 Tax=unclassified Wolbachia TaxID=2640676 RepID=UPI00222E39BC|nr:hypothetical protein [Wolbachia endosymbiont (group B) of Melanostoma mellinum]
MFIGIKPEQYSDASCFVYHREMVNLHQVMGHIYVKMQLVYSQIKQEITLLGEGKDYAKRCLNSPNLW